MAKRKKVKSIRGVELHALTGGRETVRIRYSYDGRTFRETVGEAFDSKDRETRNKCIDEGRRVLTERRQSIRLAKLKREPWAPPRELAEQKLRERQQQEDTRRALLFEVASERFLTACASEYARPAGVKRLFRRPLAQVFTGRYLDEITRPGIRQYYLDRLEGSGPFADWPNVGLRSPQTEITALSALYTWLLDGGHELDNPCHRPRTRRNKGGKLGAYKREREPVIASPPGADAICDAVLAYQGRRRKVADGPSAEARRFRALFTVARFTAARPESETCRLRHGDVRVADQSPAAVDGLKSMGAVVYRDTKTGQDRTVPLHPKAEAALLAVMEPRPTEPAMVEAWKARPIFPKPTTPSESMDRHFYKTAWKLAVKQVAETFPELAGMVLRDFRATGRTIMTDAGVPEATVRRVLGHKGDVSDGYHRPDLAMKLAVLTLDGEKSYTDLYTEAMKAREARSGRLAKVV